MPNQPARPSFQDLPVAHLRPHPDRVSHFAATDLHDAAQLDSVREFGILCPVAVSPEADGAHTVIDGHRRLACAKALGHATVPCAVHGFQSEAASLKTLFVLNTMTKPWSQAARRAYFLRVGLTPGEVEAVAGLSELEQGAYLRKRFLDRGGE